MHSRIHVSKTAFTALRISGLTLLTLSILLSLLLFLLSGIVAALYPFGAYSLLYFNDPHEDTTGLTSSVPPAGTDGGSSSIDLSTYFNEKNIFQVSVVPAVRYGFALASVLLLFPLVHIGLFYLQPWWHDRQRGTSAPDEPAADGLRPAVEQQRPLQQLRVSPSAGMTSVPETRVSKAIQSATETSVRIASPAGRPSSLTRVLSPQTSPITDTTDTTTIQRDDTLVVPAPRKFFGGTRIFTVSMWTYLALSAATALVACVLGGVCYGSLRNKDLVYQNTHLMEAWSDFFQHVWNNGNRGGAEQQMLVDALCTVEVGLRCRGDYRTGDCMGTASTPCFRCSSASVRATLDTFTRPCLQVLHLPLVTLSGLFLAGALLGSAAVVALAAVVGLGYTRLGVVPGLSWTDYILASEEPSTAPQELQTQTTRDGDGMPRSSWGLPFSGPVPMPKPPRKGNQTHRSSNSVVSAASIVLQDRPGSRPVRGNSIYSDDYCVGNGSDQSSPAFAPAGLTQSPVDDVYNLPPSHAKYLRLYKHAQQSHASPRPHALRSSDSHSSMSNRSGGAVNRPADDDTADGWSDSGNEFSENGSAYLNESEEERFNQ